MEPSSIQRTGEATLVRVGGDSVTGNRGKRQLQAGRGVWEVSDNAALSKGGNRQCHKGMEALEPKGQCADELLGQ